MCFLCFKFFGGHKSFFGQLLDFSGQWSVVSRNGLFPPNVFFLIKTLNLQVGALPTLRDPITLNRKPGKQILQNDTDVTIGCLRGWEEPDCQTCIHGWRKPNCDACAPNFGPPGECTSCLTGWAGENCDYCEGFGFSEESGCTECIENGRWVGTLTLYLTFEPPECINLVPGMNKRITINNKITITEQGLVYISTYFEGNLAVELYRINRAQPVVVTKCSNIHT